MPQDTARSVRLRPRPNTRIAGLAIAVLLGAPIVVAAPQEPRVLWGLPPLALILLLTRALTASVVIRPGVDARWRDVLLRPRALPIDASTRMWTTLAADATSGPARRLGTPHGVYNAMWVAVRTDGARPVLRLSRQQWPDESIDRVRDLLPAPLEAGTAGLPARELVRAQPWMYTWLERHYRVFQALYVATILWLCVTVLFTIGSALLVTGQLPG
ncbi:hypothetical protein QT381_05385 [Galbitalea sp. SE-J8]|uniref:hypothetical protein n=1 Tax=Galbitalea sp. SE-J8 TaxID=3054952 RepID=UPI00259D1CB8|nr:hypothetical protein [Galbitalea sp. SE-J8]MDM4762437.1 hypothetical protein [Galbitalea sp. SE-J8]